MINQVFRFITRIFGSRNERILRRLAPLIQAINSLEPEMQALSDSGLREMSDKLRARVVAGESLDDVLPAAFALVRETSVRTPPPGAEKGLRHFDVQLLGGIVLHQGKISEMSTGEGKTLVATAPAYLNALSGRGVHVITVNDYLARRDSEWMGPIYERLGMRVGCIQSSLSNAERKSAYDADITYGTNNEFGFDYLRDNMKSSLADQVQRRNYAILDEVDNILIDEARTPLIISGMSEGSTAKYARADSVARRLRRDEHFEVKEKEHQVLLNEEGIERAQELLGVDSFYSGRNMEWPHLLEQALRAHHIYKLDVDYVIDVEEGKREIVIIDEFTGRKMSGRRWSDGLHQAVEAKEKITVRAENQTLATITFQNFFKLYDKLAGMTGTAMTEAGEFLNIYGLDVLAVPTNRPMVRDDQDDKIYANEKDKFFAVLDDIREENAKGRPILVGTTSIEKSELLSGLLSRRGIEHSVLNAKHHEREAEIVARAGEAGRVTIATNMAGRGTDIKLGVGVREAGGLHVLGTERHDARRIDNQLRGRGGRQGDPGTSRFFLSLEDDLMRKFASDRVKSLLGRLGLKDGQAIEHKWVTGAVERAQKKVEERNFGIRKQLLEYDEVMNEQRTLVYDHRQQILRGEGLRDLCEDMIRRSLSRVLDAACPPKEPREQWNLDEIRGWLKRKLGIEISDLNGDRSDLDERLFATITSIYDERTRRLSPEMVTLIERFVLLNAFDSKWKEHLYNMDALKSGIGLRAHGGYEDPKTAYKREGYSLFDEMLRSIEDEVSEYVLRLEPRSETAEQELAQDSSRWGGGRAVHQDLGDSGRADMEQAAHSQQGAPEEQKPFRHEGPRVGRNDPCTCGSGKKFKKCHGVGM